MSAITAPSRTRRAAAKRPISTVTRCWRSPGPAPGPAARRRCSPSATSPNCATARRAKRWRGSATTRRSPIWPRWRRSCSTNPAFCLVFGPAMHLQAPPNRMPDALEAMVAAGINDWGGVSPVTPDHVNPEAPWPALDLLADRTAGAGKLLLERLAIYPAYAQDPTRWLGPALRTPVLRAIDAQGFARPDNWIPGAGTPPPLQKPLTPALSPQAGRGRAVGALQRVPSPRSRGEGQGEGLFDILERATAGETLAESDIVRLFKARGGEFHEVCAAADDLRRAVNGGTVTYVVTRNINYTNICYFRCQFCAFSKGKLSENLRGRPYNLDMDEIVRRCEEAWERGATEECLQGGLHP